MSTPVSTGAVPAESLRPTVEEMAFAAARYAGCSDILDARSTVAAMTVVAEPLARALERGDLDRAANLVRMMLADRAAYEARRRELAAHLDANQAVTKS